MWWKRKKSPLPDPVESALEQLEGRLQLQYEANSKSVNEQISKLLRMQYKSTQEIQSKLEQLDSHQQTSIHQQEAVAADHSAAIKKLQVMSEGMIGWLDDMDAIQARLQGGDTSWRILLQQWSAQVLQSLAKADIHELQVLGTRFNPQWCEAIGTVPREQNSIPAASLATPETVIPYEVVEVARRGFVTGTGQIIRKSKVITVEEI